MVRRKRENGRLLGMGVFLCMLIAAAGTSWANGRFVDNGDGTVTDKQTGLMWQKADDRVDRNWQEAVDHCESLGLAGYSDWRAPGIDELETIVDYDVYDPAAFDPPFSTASDYYWSGSTLAGYPDYAWSVYFYYGYVGASIKYNYYYVRCVRGGPFWPFDRSSDFQTPAGKPGVVLDTRWGYMWQKGDSGGPLNWEEAGAYCADRDLDGYSDWHLPEIDALVTIVNYTTYNPAMSPIFDPRRSETYWSGSTHASIPDYAWYVSFHGGDVYAYYKNYRGDYVRCVREGPGSLVPLTLEKAGSGTGRVTSDPARIDCGTSCPAQSANFAQLTQLTLTAEADPGSTFIGWSGGGCSGTGACQLTVGSDPLTIVAQFDRPAAVPTFSRWGVILFAILTAASALALMRRRRHS